MSQLPAEGRGRKRAPQLPRIVTEMGYECSACGEKGTDRRQREWHRLTTAWWHDIWHSPMAAEFLEADMHALYRLAVLIDRFWYESSAKSSAKLAAEIRQQQTAFGLTPIDRRRLQWEVERVESATRKRLPAPPPAKGATPPADPRSVLSAVK
ncbi:MAG TPA: hypothetical protein VNL15_06175 [Dehalococcoidia bacterium]|nr:hypothetical protein [Dehalococcoidia bacterium]